MKPGFPKTLYEKKLLFVWYLLICNQNEERFALDGDEVFKLPLEDFIDYGILNRSELESFIREFIDEDLIQAYRLTTSEGNLECSLNINEHLCEQYRDVELCSWLTDQEIKKGQSTVRASKQLEILLNQIFSMLDTFSPHMMVLECEDRSYDFITLVIFLDRVGALKIHNIEYDVSDRDVFAFRVDILDDFYRLFPKAKVSSKNMLNLFFHPAESKKRIVFEPPKTLCYEDKRYQMRSGASLYLIDLVKEDGKVSKMRFEEVLRAKGIPYDLEAIYERLRATLRQKFGFSSDERFFTIEKGMIEFSDLFDFHIHEKQ